MNRMARHTESPKAGLESRPEKPLEIWGGVEYTCNRVHDRYFDQMGMSGHIDRLGDFSQIAELGIKVLRRGLLWEHYERDKSWNRFDACMKKMTETGIQPIVGLLHHGSGPEHTSLRDEAFPKKFAAYAGAVAARYPWVSQYTPVNEPHTTARFSGMYGIWYPHHLSRGSYLRALLLQVKATVLGMEAIREVRSDALLVQTEDLGRIRGTRELSSQCELLNERRWLVFDLLCGRVGRHHPVFPYLLENGIADREILWFRDNPSPPDVIGVNYYLTSDRYLDHRVDLFPVDRRSADGNFIDIEAVRVCPDGICGFESVVREGWDRFHLPLAITEVHLGGEVCEQIRWAVEAWHAALKVRSEGANCVAITFWAMLGSFFWDALVTRDNGHYQPGVFDVRSGIPCATELAEVVRQLTRGEEPRHPALNRLGWWRSPDRICFNPEQGAVNAAA
jgi:beta-glucosidase/6-phospho-beta-glucosidase/beta-galactosidase